MGSLYFGWVTPTEAAAVGCFAAFVVSAIWGNLGWKEMRAALVAAVMISGNILLIVYTAFVFSYAISVAGVGEDLTTWMVGLKLRGWNSSSRCSCSTRSWAAWSKAWA